MKRERHTRLFVLFLGAVMLTSCTDMYDGQKFKPLEETSFFDNRLSSRPLVEGTVPRGHLQLDEHLYAGRVKGQLVTTFPFEVTPSIMARGKERFTYFCSPCHGRLGDGNGIIVQRGFPKPRSFLSDTLRIRPVGHFFDVITNGYGRMYSYAASVPVDDRWAIAAYIRALQYSMNANLEELTESDRARLP